MNVEVEQKNEFATDEGREWIRGVLRMHEDVTITFVKKDGTDRVMKCTLREDLIPADKSPKGSTKAQPKESLAVFDKELSDWRSFRFDSIKKVEFSL